MKKNKLFIISLFLNVFFLFSQEKNNISNDQLNNMFFSNDDMNSIFFSKKNVNHYKIKSFDALGNKIPLCINEKLEIFLDCENRIKYAQIIDSKIYDNEMNLIGHCYFGKITEKNIYNFWKTLKHWKGNITIYDETESFRIATFMYLKKEKDYFSIMNLDTTATVKMLKKSYKRLLKTYNINKFPDDDEIIAKNKEIEEAFIAISKKIDPDYEDNNNWLEDFFSKNRRSMWSQDEGYVPYIKREIKELKPISRDNKERYPFLD